MPSCVYKPLSTTISKCRRKNCATCKDFTPESVHKPAYEERDKVWRYKKSAGALSWGFDNFFRRAAEQQPYDFRKKRHHLGHYEFIPMGASSIVSALTLLKEHMSKEYPKFLDCGAGMGNAVILAFLLGFNAFGIEYSEETIKKGRQFLDMFCGATVSRRSAEIQWL